MTVRKIGVVEQAPDAPLAAPTADAGASLQVFVRMYRGLLSGHDYKGWLGDCFLIRLISGERKTHILIDCGILVGSPESTARVEAVAADILKETESKLDLLVVTHEHADHMSGFAQAPEYFFGAEARLKIGQLWMAWTEKPGDPQADALRAKFKQSGAALTAVAAKAAAMGFSSDGATNGLQRFTPAAADALGLATEKVRTAQVMDKLKEQVGLAATTFWEPGSVTATPGAVSLRAYVLGPPRKPEFLFKDLPTKADVGETYLAASFNQALIDDFAALPKKSGEEAAGSTELAATPGKSAPAADLSGHSPFSPRYRAITVAEVEPRKGGEPPASEAVAWLRQTYYPAAGSDDPERNRRRIDGDWMAAVAPLALKLDSDTNNTSLALAFDLPDESVMLFAADAQVGNWESWHAQPYPVDGKQVTAADLLARVRLYKVGHHGSHNATLKERGLALMTRPDLVALIPTDEDLGKKQGRQGWKMPDPDVYAELIMRTHGRVMRNDDPLPLKGDASGAPDAEAARAARLRASGDADFASRVTETALFIEYQPYGPL